MTAATNPQTVTFGTGPFTFSVAPSWRNLQIDNQTSAAVTVTIQTLAAVTIQAVTVAAATTFAVGMATALPNANLIAGNTASYDDSTAAPLHGEGSYFQEQGSNVNWTAQTIGQNGALGGQVVITGTASSGNVYLSWL